MVGSELTIFSNIIGAFTISVWRIITQAYGDLLGSPQGDVKNLFLSMKIRHDMAVPLAYLRLLAYLFLQEIWQHCFMVGSVLGERMRVGDPRTHPFSDTHAW